DQPPKPLAIRPPPHDDRNRPCVGIPHVPEVADQRIPPDERHRASLPELPATASQLLERRAARALARLSRHSGGSLSDHAGVPDDRRSGRDRTSATTAAASSVLMLTRWRR